MQNLNDALFVGTMLFKFMSSIGGSNGGRMIGYCKTVKNMYIKKRFYDANIPKNQQPKYQLLHHLQLLQYDGAEPPRKGVVGEAQLAHHGSPRTIWQFDL